MTPEQLAKLQAATNGISLPNPHRDMSQNAPKCPVLPRANVEKCEANPPTAQPSTRMLPERQAVAVEMLVAGRSSMDVVRALRIDRKTLYRWRREARFRLAIAERLAAVRRDLAVALEATATRSRRATPPLRATARRGIALSRQDSGPTLEERRAMERTFALAGIVPSWKRSATNAKE